MAAITDCRLASEYYLGTNHFVWLATDFITPATPTLPTETITTTGVTAPGTNVTINLVAATTQAYYKNQFLRFGTAGAYKVVQLAADYAVGVTALVAKEVLTSIPDGDTAVTPALVPLYSLRASTPSVEGETLEIRSAGACDWSSTIMLKRMHSLSINGPQVRNDPGLAVLKEAACAVGKQVYALMVKADGTGWSGYYHVESFTHPHETDTEVTVDFALKGDVSPTEDLEYVVA